MSSRPPDVHAGAAGAGPEIDEMLRLHGSLVAAVDAIGVEFDNFFRMQLAAAARSWGFADRNRRRVAPANPAFASREAPFGHAT